MGTSNNKFFEWNSSSSLSTRISIYKFTINEEIKSELQERIVKTCGEISLRLNVVETRFKKKGRKKKKTLHPAVSDWISIRIGLYHFREEEREKKKKSPLITDPATAQTRR